MNARFDYILVFCLVLVCAILFFSIGIEYAQAFPSENYVFIKEKIYREETLFINQNVMDRLNQMHSIAADELREHGLCLEMEDDTVIGIEGEEIIGTISSVDWTNNHCDRANIHTHFTISKAKALCRMSPSDVLFLDSANKSYGLEYEFIICDENEVVAFSVDDYNRAYKVLIVQ